MSNMTRQEYDAITALNYSGMKELLKSPAHYQAYLNAERVETKALRVGTMVHLAILQSDLWQNYKPAPMCDKRTREGKELYAAFQASLKPGQQVVDLDEHELVMNIADSVGTTKEKLGVDFIATELMLTSEDAGVPLKCSIDAVGSDGYLYDIKTCEAADARSFMGSVLSYKYFLQAYVYLHIYNMVIKDRLKGFRFIACEKTPPYASAVFTLGPELMTRGSFDYETALKLYKHCVETKEWPGYTTEVQVLDLQPKQIGSSTPITFA
jgi:exodeoxyribonuclease VIII